MQMHMHMTLRLVSLALASLCLIPQGHAAEWSVNDSLGLQLNYSDYEPAQGASQQGFLLQAQPSIDLTGTGRRLQLAFAYSPDLVWDAEGDSSGNDARLNHHLNASLQSELSPHLLFLNASATASLNNVSTQGPIVEDGLLRNDNQVQTYTLSVNPYTTHRLGGVATLQNSYTLSEVIVEGSQVTDSVSHQFSSSVTNANRARPLGWSLRATHSMVSYGGDQEDSNSSLSGGLSYRWDAHWAFSGDFGYQYADVRTARSDTRGIVWSLGTSWTPNPRTQLTAAFGTSYYGVNWDIGFSHRTRRTSLAFSYSRSISNVRNFLASDQAGTGINPSLTTEDYLADQAQLSVSVKGRRTTLSSAVVFSKQAYEVSGLQDWSLSWDLGATRQLAKNLSANARVYLGYLDPNGPGDSRISQYSAGLSRGIGRHSSLGMDVSHRKQTGTSSSAYTDKRVGLSFRTSFL